MDYHYVVLNSCVRLRWNLRAENEASRLTATVGRMQLARYGLIERKRFIFSVLNCVSFSIAICGSVEHRYDCGFGTLDNGEVSKMKVDSSGDGCSDDISEMCDMR